MIRRWEQSPPERVTERLGGVPLPLPPREPSGNGPSAAQNLLATWPWTSRPFRVVKKSISVVDQPPCGVFYSCPDRLRQWVSIQIQKKPSIFNYQMNIKNGFYNGLMHGFLLDNQRQSNKGKGRQYFLPTSLQWWQCPESTGRFSIQVSHLVAEPQVLRSASAALLGNLAGKRIRRRARTPIWDACITTVGTAWWLTAPAFSIVSLI